MERLEKGLIALHRSVLHEKDCWLLFDYKMGFGLPVIEDKAQAAKRAEHLRMMEQAWGVKDEELGVVTLNHEL